MAVVLVAITLGTQSGVTTTDIIVTASTGCGADQRTESQEALVVIHFLYAFLLDERSNNDQNELIRNTHFSVCILGAVLIIRTIACQRRGTLHCIVHKDSEIAILALQCLFLHKTLKALHPKP